MSARPEPFAFAFTFAFQTGARLPPLAWCAHAVAGSPLLSVRHGVHVEVRRDGFVEGAWDGPFAGFGFAAASSMAGTGGVLQASGRGVPGTSVRFVGGSARQDRLYVARAHDALWVSNSLPFALVASGDEPDPRRTDAVAAFIAQVRTLGATTNRWTMRTRRGEVEMFEGCDVVMGADLALTLVPKPAPPEPHSYAEVIALLAGVVARTFANAADGARVRRYLPLATVSRGYDSPAAAVLAARAGCREALTFAERAPGSPSDDDGTAVGERLGLRVLARARDDWRTRTDLPEAETWACPPGAGLAMASAEGELAGRIVVNGHFGDRLFADRAAEGGRIPPLSLLTAPSQTELRLRVGYLAFAPFFAARQHVDAVRRISASPELAPFRVGGPYDRPIPRRLLEEAGVPGTWFGQTKMAGAVIDILDARDLTPASRADFAAFVAQSPELAAEAPEVRASRLANLVLRRSRRALKGPLRAAGLPVPRPVGAWPRVHDGRLFAWGFARTRSRYAP